MNDGTECERRMEINVESQLREIQKSLHQRYQNDKKKKKKNELNNSECKEEDKSKCRKSRIFIVRELIISGIIQLYLIKGRIVKVKMISDRRYVRLH